MTSAAERVSDNRESDRIVGSLVARVDLLEDTIKKVSASQEELLAMAHRIEGGLSTARGGWGLIAGGVGVVCGAMASWVLSTIGTHFKWQ